MPYLTLLIRANITRHKQVNVILPLFPLGILYCLLLQTLHWKQLIYTVKWAYKIYFPYRYINYGKTVMWIHYMHKIIREYYIVHSCIIKCFIFSKFNSKTFRIPSTRESNLNFYWTPSFTKNKTYLKIKKLIKEELVQSQLASLGCCGTSGREFQSF